MILPYKSQSYFYGNHPSHHFAILHAAPGLPASDVCFCPYADRRHGLYFSVSTVTTTGYGDLYPETTNGKIFVVFYQIISVGIILLFFNTIYQHFDDVKNSQRIRRYRHKKMVKRAMREQKRREQKEKNTHN